MFKFAVLNQLKIESGKLKMKREDLIQKFFIFNFQFSIEETLN